MIAPPTTKRYALRHVATSWSVPDRSLYLSVGNTLSLAVVCVVAALESVLTWTKTPRPKILLTSDSSSSSLWIVVVVVEDSSVPQDFDTPIEN